MYKLLLQKAGDNVTIALSVEGVLTAGIQLPIDTLVKAQIALLSGSPVSIELPVAVVEQPTKEPECL